MKPTPTTRPSYWLETVCFRDAYTVLPELLDRGVYAAPEEAVRAMRMQIRSGHPFGLSGAEAERALAWLGGAGRVQALAALHRGESAGFGVVRGDGLRAEWRVLPVHCLELAAARPCDPGHTRGVSQGGGPPCPGGVDPRTSTEECTPWTHD
ncbi:hypothetical protein [Streptomyces sp. NPDC089919]|uniref:hypothetical protein n=1 Tax=Streptomyces sp. NPDC089919 TaxID=3155188 RepID=UPI0034193695